MEKSFSYRFENILDIKEKLEDQKKNALGEALQRLEQAEESLGQWKERKRKAVDEWNQQAKNIQKVQFFLQSGDHFQYFDQMIRRGEQEVKERKKKVQEARNQLMKAKQDTKVFEKIKEKDYEHHRIKEQRKENELIDQIVTHKSSRK